jgi:hypothetical protein
MHKSADVRMDYRQTPRGGWRKIHDRWDRWFSLLIFIGMLVLLLWMLFSPNDHASDINSIPRVFS